MSKIGVVIEGRSFVVELNAAELSPGAGDAVEATVTVDRVALRVTIPAAQSLGAPEWLIVDGRPYEIALDPELTRITSAGRRYPLELRNLEAAVERPASRDGRVKAPIPGLITRILVQPEQQIIAGQALFVLEAMKMENEIRAPRAGTLAQIHVKVGQAVTLHEVLAEVI